MSEDVLDRDALSEMLSSCRGLRELSQALLKRFVASNGNGAPVSGRCIGAVCAYGASVAQLGLELDRGAEVKGLRLTLWAGDGAIANVDVEQ